LLLTSHSPSSQAGYQTPENPVWTDLVERIRRGEPSGLQELYEIFSRGVRFFLKRQLGEEDLDDKVHDAFLVIAQSIQRGELREPKRLMGYIRTIVRRQVAAYIEQAVQKRRHQTDLDLGGVLCDSEPDPEKSAIERQNRTLAMRVMQSIPKRDREILTRYYLYEQPAERICAEMDLTETQFRLIKSRAKARFGELGRRRLALRAGFRA
jgi:RNA polymerase sigma factor (sigma-70 family)